MKISELKKGQRVRVTLEGVVTTGPDSSEGYVTFDGDNAGTRVSSRKKFYIGKDRTEEIEILPEPIKVGDRVSISQYPVKIGLGTVTLIDNDGWYVIKFDRVNTIPYGSFKIDRLTKINEGCDC